MRNCSKWGLAPALLASAAFVGCGGDSTAPATTTPAAESAPAADEGSEKKDDGSGDKTSEVRFNVENLPTLALLVPDIHCEACAANVNSTLAEVDGVEDISIDVEAKTATIAIDEETFSSDAAFAALADAAFPASPVEEEEDAATAEDAS